MLQASLAQLSFQDCHPLYVVQSGKEETRFRPLGSKSDLVAVTC